MDVFTGECALENDYFWLCFSFDFLFLACYCAQCNNTLGHWRIIQAVSKTLSEQCPIDAVIHS